MNPSNSWEMLHPESNERFMSRYLYLGRLRRYLRVQVYSAYQVVKSVRTATWGKRGLDLGASGKCGENLEKIQDQQSQMTAEDIQY